MTAALLTLFDQFVAQSSAEHKAWIERAVTMACAMIEEGEPDIALENFCENLIEWQCPLTASLFAALQQQASALGVDEAVVQSLKQYVR